MLLALLLAAALDTVVQTQSFRTVLPGAWKSVSSNDAIVFEQGDDLVYLTTLEPKEPFSRADRDRMAYRLADMRAKLIGDLSRGTATLTGIEKTSDTAKTMCAFRGEDPQNGKRIYVGVLAFPNIVVTVALYRPLTASAEGFDRLGPQIASSTIAK